VSPNLTARDGVGVGEDAGKTVFWGCLGLSVGLCPDFLTTNAHTSERNSYYQVSCSELEWGHLGAAPPMQFYEARGGNRASQIETRILKSNPFGPQIDLLAGYEILCR